MKRLSMLVGMLCAITIGFSQNIVKAEYFIDVDPGQGNGTPVPNFTAGDTVNFSASIPTAILSNGFHYLGVRVGNANGTWSRYEARGFYLSSTTAVNVSDITAAEFFIDSDPGAGMGWPAAVGTNGAVVNFTAVSPVPLTPGFHFIAIRVKDGDGKWGLFEQRGFYVTPFPVNMPPLTAAEYFYDTDPGVGNGIPLDLAVTGDSINQSFLISVPSNLTGQHLIGFRVRDQWGNWSFIAKDTVNISAAATISCPGNIAVTASAGQCSAVVNNIDPSISPSGAAYTYTLTGATTGNGGGTASGHIFNPGVTTVTYALSNSPTTNCSFNVTVNSNAAALVSIQASQTSICPGQMVTFTAIVTNGGTDPTFEWTKNGSAVGSDTSVFQTTSLANGDVIRVTMQPYGSCAGNGAVYSNSITMTVGTGATPSVTIAASAIDICTGTPVTFTANPVNGGSNPSYQWKLNGNNIPGATNSTYQSSTLANNDTVRVVMTSSMSCTTSPTVTSNYISMDVSPSMTPLVTIAASQTNICPGTQVTFTATPVNGGNSPAYQWKLNGNNIAGATGSSYQSSTLATADVVTVAMISSQPCASQIPVSSNSITMIVGGGGLTPSVQVNATATTICPGMQVTFTAVPTNGGNTPAYQWRLNGNIIAGATGNTYQSSTLTNGNIVSVEMTTSLTCATQPTATHGVAITVNPTVVPSAGLTPSATSICTGTLVTFTADEVNGGDHPSWQWKINGNNVGTDSIVFQSSTLQDGDVVSVVLTSSFACASPTTSTSNIVTMQVSQALTFWRDLDGDGYGGYYSGTTQGCTPPSGYVDNNGDCNDSAATAHPGATEICGDNIDNNCNGSIDENCVPQTVPQLSIKPPHPVKEGDVGETKAYVELNLSAPSANTTAVYYSTRDGDASAGDDYLSSSGWLYFPANSTHSIIPLRILGDRLNENNERFFINFSQPVGITFSNDSTFRMTIIDDDKGKGNNAVAETGRIPSEDELLKIPSVAKRNQVWTIPQIGRFENEISIVNAQGQVVKRFVNYQNHTPLNNVSAGLYFYRIFMVDGKNQIKYYSGRLLITE